MTEPTTNHNAPPEGKDQPLYNDAANYAIDIFHSTLDQLSALGWSLAQIVERRVDFFDGELDPKLLAEIAAVHAEHADDADDEADDDDDDYEEGELHPADM
jgi:hypothetical protein